MTTLVRSLLLLLILALPISPVNAAKRNPTKARGSKARITARDVARTVDSIHWLIERHCDNKIESMGTDDGTIDKIKMKYRSLPKATADSLIAAQYDKIVRLFEDERNNRAFALTDCYYAIAAPDDPNLGPLYLNDIVLAIERNDSILLRTRINELSAYASRNDLDYDQDLEDAEVNMILLRKRVAFNEKNFSDYVRPGEMWVLDTGGRRVADEFIPYLSTYMFMADKGKNAGKLVGANIDRVVKGDKNSMTIYTNPMHNWGFDNVVKNEEGKHYFASYSTERGGTTNPEMLASGRTLVQNLHATVSGELARKKYSYGTRVAGEIGATIIDAGLNALFNFLSVTTQYAYTAQLNLTLTQPDLLEGELNIARAKVRSDNPGNPNVAQVRIPLKYYRAYVKEDLHLINAKSEPVYGTNMGKEEYEHEKKRYKEKAGQWKREQAEWKKANKGVAPRFKHYYEFYNDSVMTILKQRAESSMERIEL